MNICVQKVRGLVDFFEKNSPRGTASLISNCSLPIIGFVGIGVYARLQKTSMLGVVAEILLNFEMTKMKMAGCAATSVFLAIFSTHDSLLGRIAKRTLNSLGSLFYFYGFGRALLLHISNKAKGAECFFAIGVGFFCTARPFLMHMISSLFFKSLISLGFKSQMNYECLADLFKKQGDAQKAFECYFLAYCVTNFEDSRARLNQKLGSLAEVLKDGLVEHSYSRKAVDFLKFMTSERFDLSKVLFYLERDTMPLRLKTLMEQRENDLKGLIDVPTIWRERLGGGNERVFVDNPDHGAFLKLLIGASFSQVSSNLRQEGVTPVEKRRTLFVPCPDEVNRILPYQDCLRIQQENSLRQEVSVLCDLIALISKLSELLKPRSQGIDFLPEHVQTSLKKELRPFLEEVLFLRCKKAIKLVLESAGVSDEDLINLSFSLVRCKYSQMLPLLQRVVNRYFEKNKDGPECQGKGKLLFTSCFSIREMGSEPFFQTFYDSLQDFNPAELRKHLTEKQRLIFSTAAFMISQKDFDSTRRIIIS